MERAPGSDLAEVRDGLRAVRIVERQYRGLGQRIGRAETGRMPRVAFDLGGPAHVALDQDPGRHSAQRRRRGEEQRLTGDDLLRSAHVRHDGLGGLARARSEAGQSERGAHELQEFPAARLARLPLRSLPGEFAEEELLKTFGPGELFQALPEPRSFGVRQPGSDSGEIEWFGLAGRSHQR